MNRLVLTFFLIILFGHSESAMAKEPKDGSWQFLNNTHRESLRYQSGPDYSDYVKESLNDFYSIVLECVLDSDKQETIARNFMDNIDEGGKFVADIIDPFPKDELYSFLVYLSNIKLHYLSHLSDSQGIIKAETDNILITDVDNKHNGASIRVNYQVTILMDSVVVYSGDSEALLTYPNMRNKYQYKINSVVPKAYLAYRTSLANGTQIVSPSIGVETNQHSLKADHDSPTTTNVSNEIVEYSTSELDMMLHKAVELYNVKRFDESYRLLTNYHEGLKAKGVHYEKLSEWINKCKVAYELDKLGVDTSFNYCDGVCRFILNKKFGFIDSTGTVIVQPVLNEALDFKSGVAWVMKDDLWGSIDKSGSFVVNPQYDDVYELNEKDYAQNRCMLVEKNELFGLVDIKTGEVIEPIKYTSTNGRFGQIKGASFVYLATKKTRKLVDLATGTEKVNLPKNLEFREVIYENYFLVRDIKKYSYSLWATGIMHYKDGLILEPNYFSIRLLSLTHRELILLYQSRLDKDWYSIYNLRTRNMVSDRSFRGVLGFSLEYPFVIVEPFHFYDYAILDVNDGQLFGYTDFSYENIHLPEESSNTRTIVVEKGDTIKLYDFEHNEYIAPRSEIDVRFNGDYAIIRQNGKYGFINNHGEIVVPCQYDSTSGYNGNISPVVMKANDIVYLYDLDLKVYQAPTSEIDIKFDSYGHARICQNGKYGFINKRGKIIVPCEYYFLSDFGFYDKGVVTAKAYISKETYDQNKPTALIKIDIDSDTISIMNLSEVSMINTQ